MNAIVIVFIPKSGSTLAERPIAIPSIDFGAPKTSPPESSGRDQSAPPFWTWFIQNPRARGELQESS